MFESEGVVLFGNVSCLLLLLSVGVTTVVVVVVSVVVVIVLVKAACPKSTKAIANIKAIARLLHSQLHNLAMLCSYTK